jgi:NAD(P)-dependent dehydrogenase (short-subunit alcohol dehydrogenase family)
MNTLTNQDLQGKFALVTGGGTGIGRSSALALAERGAFVVIAGRTASTGEEAVAAVRSAGGQAEFVKTDVTKENEVKALIDGIVSKHGRLDIAFNNAGVEGKMGPLTELSETDFDTITNGNVKSVWLSMKYQVPAMLKNGQGSIINNSSIVGHVGAAGIAAYSASKHAVEGLTRSAALEYAKTGVRINAVAPGAIETPMADRMFGSAENLNKTFGAAHPVGRAGKPEEVAPAVVWLASDAASFITGHILNTDGGYSAQ